MRRSSDRLKSWTAELRATTTLRTTREDARALRSSSTLGNENSNAQHAPTTSQAPSLRELRGEATRFISKGPRHLSRKKPEREVSEPSAARSGEMREREFQFQYDCRGRMNIQSH